MAQRSEADPRRTPSLRRRGLRLGLFLLVQAFAVLGVLEIIARIGDPLGISYYPETASFLDRLIREEGIGYRLPPDLDGRFWGAAVRTNALGMRDREVDFESPAEEFRVLFLGDSWAFGLGVGDEETIPRRLEALLDERMGDESRARTLNLGVPSYNTEQELIVLQDLGLRLDPDLVLLMFAINDIEAKTWVLDKRAGWLPSLAQRSYALSLLTILQRRLRQAVADETQPADAGPYAPDHPRRRTLEHAMLEIARICRERSLPFVVLSRMREDDLPLAVLRELGQEGGFPVVNVLPTDDPRWRDVPLRALENSAVDSHPNAKGTTVEAILILEALERLGLVPTASSVDLGPTNGALP